MGLVGWLYLIASCWIICTVVIIIFLSAVFRNNHILEAQDDTSGPDGRISNLALLWYTATGGVANNSAHICKDRLGAPLFEATSSSKLYPVVHLREGDSVWCIIPYGIFQCRVRHVSESESGQLAIIRCDDYDVSVRSCHDYFSCSIADELRLASRSTFVVTDVRKTEWHVSYKTYASGAGCVYKSTIDQHQGAGWIYNHTIFGDFTNIMISELWYELMFIGFTKPVSFYKSLTPIRDKTDYVVDWYDPNRKPNE